LTLLRWTGHSYLLSLSIHHLVHSTIQGERL
jgi:hypothetical protein